MSSRKLNIKLKKSHAIGLAIGTLIIAIILWGAVFLQYKVQQVQAEGLVLYSQGHTVTISADQIGFSGNGLQWFKLKLSGKPVYNPISLRNAIAQSPLVGSGTVKNMGVAISGGQASLDTTSTPGIAINQDDALSQAGNSLDRLQNHVTLVSTQVQPTVTMQGAETAVEKTQMILSNGITVSVNNANVQIPTSTIGSWIVQKPNGPNIKLSFDPKKIANDLQLLTSQYSQPESDLDFDMDANGQITNFQAPKDGMGIDMSKAVQNITALLQSRLDGSQAAASASTSPIMLTIQTIHGGVSDHAKSLGIEELIGSATTPFTGSTKNRIHNITTGAAKLNGSLVEPGQEFSTIKTLGDIGPDTGYVEELVILGPKTVPAYGGGLCQVSTTLFRSILNAGLPVTARANHSYRVSFYEKDGDGNSIGPGLDATIYDPNPDLKFMNDTGHPVLITDQIVGTKITFSLYGTSDGRTSTVTGPAIVRTLPPPAAQTVYSATLPAGEVKQTEFARTGADTTATYDIHYADGTTKTQVFNSHYHGMPAIYITNDPSAAPAAVASNAQPATTSGAATPTPTPAD